MKFCYVSLRMASVLLLFALLGISAHAQRKAPGYMGRRFLLKYDQGISWNLGKNMRGIPNLFYNLQGDLALSLKVSAGLEYSFMNRNKYNGETLQYEDLYSTNYKTVDLGMTRTMLHRAGAYVKMFSRRNGHIAPAGPYMIAGFHVYALQARFKKRTTFYDDSYYPTSSTNTFVNKTFIDVAPFFGGGKQYILANRMVLDFNVRFSLPVVGLLGGIGDAFSELGDYSNSAHERRLMRREAMLTNATANFIELRFGFGTLL